MKRIEDINGKYVKLPNFIGIEKDIDYWWIAQKRITDAQA